MPTKELTLEKLKDITTKISLSYSEIEHPRGEHGRWEKKNSSVKKVKKYNLKQKLIHANVAAAILYPAAAIAATPFLPDNKYFHKTFGTSRFKGAVKNAIGAAVIGATTVTAATLLAEAKKRVKTRIKEKEGQILELAGNPFHDKLGRFSSNVASNITTFTRKLAKKKPTTKHLKDAAKALGEAVNNYSLMNYGVNTHILATAVSTITHHIKKSSRITSEHISKISKGIIKKYGKK